MSDTYGSLIAPASGTKFYEGAGIFESVSGTVESLFKGDPGGVAGNLAATGLSALGAITDPLQMLFTASVGWAMEHVAVLREPLDKLAGDPKAIEGHAESWKKIERRIYDATDLFATEVKNASPHWTAESAVAYRRRAHDHAEALQAMGKIADGMGTATTLLGAVVGVARNTIRDIIAQAVGSILSIAVQATTGVLIPSALVKIANLVADTSMTILKVLERLLAQLKKIGRAVGKLQNLMDKVGQSNRDVLRLVAHRLEAADTMRQGLTGPFKAVGVLAQGDFRVYGATHQILVNTGRAAAQSNTAQNSGSATDNIRKSPDPIAVDLPS